MGIRGGGIQHQEYIMTFNEVLNTIATHTVLSCFISFHQRTRFGLEFKFFFIFFWFLANIEVDTIFYYMCLCCSASW